MPPLYPDDVFGGHAASRVSCRFLITHGACFMVSGLHPLAHTQILFAALRSPISLDCVCFLEKITDYRLEHN